MFEKGPKTRIVMHICWGKDTKEKIGWKFDGRGEIYSLGGYLYVKNDNMVEIRFFHLTITISIIMHIVRISTYPSWGKDTKENIG